MVHNHYIKWTIIEPQLYLPQLWKSYSELFILKNGSLLSTLTVTFYNTKPLKHYISYFERGFSEHDKKRKTPKFYFSNERGYIARSERPISIQIGQLL